MVLLRTGILSVLVPLSPEFVLVLVMMKSAPVDIEFVVPVLSVLRCVPVLLWATADSALARIMA